jgi:hypothetical protein
MRETFGPFFYDPVDSAMRHALQREMRWTLGELFPDGRSLDLIYNPESDQLELVYFDGPETEIGTTIDVLGRDYEVAQINRAFVCASVWPSRLESSYGSTADFFAAIREVFAKCGFSEDVSVASAYFVFSTWFPELLPIAPCLLIRGPQSSAKCLLDILACLVRRPLHFGELDRSVLCCLPFALRPTLLFSRQSARGQTRGILSISSRPGCLLPRGTSVVNASYPMAIYGGAEFACDDLGGSVIPVHLMPILRRLPFLSARSRQELADQFQPKFAAYRAANHVAVGRSQFTAPEFTLETRMLARALGSCIVGSPEVQVGLKNILESCEEEARAEQCCDVRCLAIEALLAFCHTRPDAKVYVGEITAAIEEIQKSRGETGALKARQTGGILRSLGIHSKRNRQGFSMVLTEKMRRQIHELARDFKVEPLEQGEPPCSVCTELLAAPDKTEVAIEESEEAKGE